MDTRVTIAEFADYLFVIEGAYNSRNCDLIAKKVHEKFNKPVKYFAFSHLHGQYIGGVRSWVAADATVLVPPTTMPMVDTIIKYEHSLRPDALSASPRELTIESIEKKKSIKDKINTIEIYNVESQHTDEYFIFYFPTQKILLTGDLLFYRPGQPLKGRSKKLCETVQKLGLDVDKYYCTWPLNSYGTKNIVTREEMAEGCK
jgi:glyoxylase-like metal-dependent hydrolase (beta-lactamase superfamily II)